MKWATYIPWHPDTNDGWLISGVAGNHHTGCRYQSRRAGGKVMQPFGKFIGLRLYCSLCRSRGYRKENGYDAELRTCKHRARQQSKRLIDKEQDSSKAFAIIDQTEL